MSRRQLPCVGFIFVVLVFLLGACASSPDVLSGQSSVQVRIAPSGDLSRYGVRSDEDPLIFPPLLLRNLLSADKQKPVVFALDLSLPKPSRIQLDADVRTEDNKSVGSLWSRADMKDFWYRNMPVESDHKMRLINLDRYYLPSPLFTAGKGHRIYYFVCAVDTPLPPSAKATVLVTIDNVDTQSFSIDLSGISENR